MSELNDRILEDLKKSMKARDGLRTSTLRMVLAAMKNEKISLKRDLEDQDMIRLITRGVKSRRESVEMYKKGGRDELAEKEAKEIEILQEYLPSQMTPQEVESAAAELVKELGIESPKQLGLFMKEFMKRYQGKADGKMAQQAAKKLLT